MNKYEVLVGLLVGFDLNEWIGYGEEYVSCDLKKLVAVDEYRWISFRVEKNGNKYESYIEGVLDTDITSAQGKELYNLLKEKWDMKQELKKKDAWLTLGVYNG